MQFGDTPISRHGHEISQPHANLPVLSHSPLQNSRRPCGLGIYNYINVSGLGPSPVRPGPCVHHAAE